VSNEAGVIAHVQHLCRYAGIQLSETILDPRYELVTPGKAVVVEDLGGKWAPSPDYGNSIVRDYLQPLVSFSAAPVEDVAALKKRLEEAESENKGLRQALAQRDNVLDSIKSLAASISPGQ
jgi:N-acetylmuramoyl-L-alanine amidase